MFPHEMYLVVGATASVTDAALRSGFSDAPISPAPGGRMLSITPGDLARRRPTTQAAVWLNQAWMR
jgi:hypothetical protein